MNEDLDLNVKISHHNDYPTCLNQGSYANFLYLNARSLRNSIKDLQQFIDTQNFIFHVIIVVETWLKPIPNSPLYVVSNESTNSTRKGHKEG